MDLEIIIAAGYDTPDRLTNFLMLDNEEQDKIYQDAIELYNIAFACDIPESQEKSA